MAQYTCRACGQTFASQSELDKHNQQAHPNTKTK
jgi:hypothetical protein